MLLRDCELDKTDNQLRQNLKSFPPQFFEDQQATTMRRGNSLPSVDLCPRRHWRVNSRQIPREIVTRFSRLASRALRLISLQRASLRSLAQQPRLETRQEKIVQHQNPTHVAGKPVWSLFFLLTASPNPRIKGEDWIVKNKRMREIPSQILPQVEVNGEPTRPIILVL